jgi:NodT family efflux transporter outer membrane factor (OMF) lipoprotein
MKTDMRLQMRQFSKGLAALAGATWLAGCAVGPDYHRPAALPGTNTVPAKLGDISITNSAEWKVAEPSAQLSRGTWWTIYNDAELNRLETLAATNNQQIALAIANFDQARAAVKVAQANFFPQISANPSATRQRTSANSSPIAATASSHTYNTFNVSADASWELDLWGRIRRLTESSRAQLAASADDLESLKLSIQAEVAMDYFTLRALDAQSEFLSQTAVAYQHALDLTQNRRKSGIADEQDVAQAETQLRSAKAQIPATDLQRAQTRHALAVLCGQPATTFALTPGTLGSTNLAAIPLSAPSVWLEHRPDVAAAERSMAAANANIGVAKAAFYPRVLLNGSGGLQSISASTLFDWPSHVWALGPTVTLPLFTGGANFAQLSSAKAGYAGAVATYRQTVLTAFQDVEDQLAAQTLLANQLDEETLALAAARRALDIANDRYKAGVEQYLDVITAETTELSHELNVIQLRGQRLATSVALIKSLGAGQSMKAPFN